MLLVEEVCRLVLRNALRRVCCQVQLRGECLQVIDVLRMQHVSQLSLVQVIGEPHWATLSMLLYSAGTAAMTIAKSYSMLIVGRIIVGLGVGVGMATVPVLVAELAPAKLRGQLTSTFEISICTGGNRFKS